MSRVKWEHYLGYLFIAPAFLFVAVFLIYPSIFAIQLSFHKWSGMTPGFEEFVGLRNYVELTRDYALPTAIRNNLIYVVGTTAGQMALGLLLAIMLDTKTIRGKVIFRTLLFFPTLLIPVSIGLIWKFMYDPVIGVINSFLTILGFRTRFAWLDNTVTVMPSIILVGIWIGTGFNMIVYYAALQNISPDLYDAAKVDGAGWWATLRNVTVPSLSPVTTLLATWNIIGGFKVFDIIWVMTQGNPYHQSDVLSTWLYFNAFYMMKMGYASTIAVFTSAIVIVTSVIFLKLRMKQAY